MYVSEGQDDSAFVQVDVTWATVNYGSLRILPSPPESLNMVSATTTMGLRSMWARTKTWNSSRLSYTGSSELSTLENTTERSCRETRWGGEQKRQGRLFVGTEHPQTLDPTYHDLRTLVGTVLGKRSCEGMNLH